MRHIRGHRTQCSPESPHRRGRRFGWQWPPTSPLSRCSSHARIFRPCTTCSTTAAEQRIQHRRRIIGVEMRRIEHRIILSFVLMGARCFCGNAPNPSMARGSAHFDSSERRRRPARARQHCSTSYLGERYRFERTQQTAVCDVVSNVSETQRKTINQH